MSIRVIRGPYPWLRAFSIPPRPSESSPANKSAGRKPSSNSTPEPYVASPAHPRTSTRRSPNLPPAHRGYKSQPKSPYNRCRTKFGWNRKPSQPKFDHQSPLINLLKEPRPQRLGDLKKRPDNLLPNLFRHHCHTRMVAMPAFSYPPLSVKFVARTSQSYRQAQLVPQQPASRHASPHGGPGRRVAGPLQRTLKSLTDELQPVTAIENLLVQKMAVAHWRQMRFWNIEKASMDHEDALALAT